MRLQKLSLLPLMYICELHDILFFIKSLKEPHMLFRSLTGLNSVKLHFNKICSSLKTDSQLTQFQPTHHFYFNRLPRLWNTLPPFHLTMSEQSLKRQLKCIFWFIFISKFDDRDFCTYHIVCPCAHCNLTPRPPLYTS